MTVTDFNFSEFITTTISETDADFNHLELDWKSFCNKRYLQGKFQKLRILCVVLHISCPYAPAFFGGVRNPTENINEILCEHTTDTETDTQTKTQAHRKTQRPHTHTHTNSTIARKMFTDRHVPRATTANCRYRIVLQE